MRSSARNALTVSGCAPGWLISIRCQCRSGAEGDITSHVGVSLIAIASAKVG